MISVDTGYPVLDIIIQLSVPILAGICLGRISSSFISYGIRKLSGRVDDIKVTGLQELKQMGRVLDGDLYGYKVLAVDYDGKGTHIKSPFVHVPWHNHSLDAQCRNYIWRYYLGDDMSSHSVPYDKCDCGIYGVYSIPSASLWTLRVYGVICLVRASGKVILGKKGWRAEQCDIVAVVDVLDRGLRDRWGVSTYFRDYDLSDVVRGLNLPIISWLTADWLIWKGKRANKRR